MTARRCQLGPARKLNRGADALQPDLAVDPPERLRCLTTAVEEPGSEPPQEERPAHASGLAKTPTSGLLGNVRLEVAAMRPLYGRCGPVCAPCQPQR
jgi:hypothetical protein